jgi:dihydrofolate reductase
MISIIAALGDNRELGKNNQLLWHIKADLVHFKNLTTGHPVIMGRKTFESIGRPLPNRDNIIVTRDKNFTAEECKIMSSLEDAIGYASILDFDEIFIIGGASIYSQAIKFADKLYLTLVKGTFDADAFFPEYSEFKKELSREEGSEGFFRFTFLELTK